MAAKAAQKKNSNVRLQAKNEILSRMRALGNTERGFKEVCSDLINEVGHDSKTFERIAQGTFLSVETVRRMAELKDAKSGVPYKPNSDTVERIMRYFGAEVSLTSVVIKSKYKNKPKKDDE